MSKMDWTDKLRNQLADYQVPANDDLWAGIEKSLAQNAPMAEPTRSDSPKTTAKKVWIRRFSMAAAIAALAVGGSYVYLHPWGNVDTAVAEQQVMTSAHANTNRSIHEETHQPASLVQKLQQLVMKGGQDEKPMLAMSSEAARVAALEVEETTMQQEAPIGQMAEEQTSKPQPAAKQKVQAKAYKQTATQDLPWETVPDLGSKRHDKAAVSLKLYGENGVAGGNRASTNVPFLASMAPSNDMPVNDAKGWHGDSETNIFYAMRDFSYTEEKEHHFPLTVGVQVGIPLSSKWAISTGLVYTRTSSDFTGTANDMSMNTTQVLHYIGVPVNVSYQVWRTSHFHTYLSAGGEGAINVKNDTKTEGKEMDSKRDRMQWSVNAAVGAQYDFLPQLGIYVEPGVKYYIDNGSDIENYFKDKKTNFNLQFGLRWTLE